MVNSVERVLADSPAVFDGTFGEFVSYYLGELDALLQVGALHHGHEDVRFRVFGVELGGSGIVVVVQHDDGVLPLDHRKVHFVQIGAFFMGLAEDVDGVAVGGRTDRRIDMYGNK